jgi:hypothetical protein
MMPRKNESLASVSDRYRDLSRRSSGRSDAERWLIVDQDTAPSGVDSVSKEKEASITVSRSLAIDVECVSWFEVRAPAQTASP